MVISGKFKSFQVISFVVVFLFVCFFSYIYIYIESKLLCRMKILKIMKNESLLCFCATRFTAVAALQA